MKLEPSSWDPPKKPHSMGVTFHRGNDLTLPPHVDAPDPLDLTGVRRWVREQSSRRLTALDLFCGGRELTFNQQYAGSPLAEHRADLG
jgi:hypothetical protein